MRCLSHSFLTIVLLAFFTTLASAQVGNSRRFFTLQDGKLQLHGRYDNLRRIEIRSPGGHLSLETEQVPRRKTDPFPASNGIVVVDEADNVVLGVLGKDKWITIEGQTTTAILYSESLDTAKAGDLTVRPGVVGAALYDFEIGTIDEIASGVTIVDGAITIVGELSDLAGIEALSEGGHLSLAEGPGDLLRLLEPFTPKWSTLAATDQEIDVRVVHPQFQIDIDGETPTSFLYSESDEVARKDLTVSMTLGSKPAIRVPFLVPEPGSQSMATLGAVLAFLAICRYRVR